MKIAVCVKQIPDPASELFLDPKNRLDRTGKLVLDDADTYGIEMALRLVEDGNEGEVVLFSMAPHNEVAGLRTGLSLGASRAVLISDDVLSNSDSLSTAKVLSAAISQEDFDLVITGTESTDGYSGIMAAQLAELMQLPSVTFVKKVTRTQGDLLVERQTELGFDEVKLKLPGLISLTAGSVEPRYPNFKGIMAAKSKPIKQLLLSDLGIDASEVGTNGARQEIVDVTVAPTRASGDVIEDTGEGYVKIVEYLEALKIV